MKNASAINMKSYFKIFRFFKFKNVWIMEINGKE